MAGKALAAAIGATGATIGFVAGFVLSAEMTESRIDETKREAVEIVVRHLERCPDVPHRPTGSSR